MKIRFASYKEKQPTHEQGLSVLYAPGKRMAFKVRWYLILFVVVSPLVFLAGRWLISQLLIEAPAQVVLQTFEVRSPIQGMVSHLSVQVGDQIQAGNSVVELDNPEWRERLFHIKGQAADAIPSFVSSEELLAEQATINAQLKHAEDQLRHEVLSAERAVVKAQLKRAEERLRQVEILFSKGAAIRPEVQSAELVRDNLLRDSYQLEQRRLQVASVDTVQVQDRQRELEQSWLESRLADMSIKAPQAGRVQEIFVGAGEFVGPGTLIMRLASEKPARVWVYLDSKQAGVAEIGMPLTLYFPNGDERQAHVSQSVSEAAVAPSDLRLPFSAPDRSLRVQVEVEGGLPEQWRIDRLGLRARFPHSSKLL